MALPKTFVKGFHDENIVRKMKYSSMGVTDMTVSELSLGSAGFCLNYGPYNIEECKLTVLEALKNGINYIDTAPWYGQGLSESILGQCLKNIPRKAYYIATKVGRYEKDPRKMFDFSGEKTRQSIDESLKKLGITYIDLIQIHDVEFAFDSSIIFNETIPVIQEAIQDGKVKYMGITGYPISTLVNYVEKSHVRFDCVLSYTRLSLLNQSLKEALPVFQKNHMGIINAAPHCMGLLSDSGPPDWHPASDEIKKICQEANDYCKMNNVELGKLAMYYAFNETGPHTTLVGINNRKYLQINLNIYFKGLSNKEKSIYDYLKTQLLPKLSITDWEGIEIKQYLKLINN